MCWGCVNDYATAEYGEDFVAVSREAARTDERVLAARDRCRELHALPHCSAGGPLHVVVDDTNVEDEFLDLDGFDEWRRSCESDGGIPAADVAMIRAAAEAVLDALRPLTLTERAVATMLA